MDFPTPPLPPRTITLCFTSFRFSWIILRMPFFWNVSLRGNIQSKYFSQLSHFPVHSPWTVIRLTVASFFILSPPAPFFLFSRPPLLYFLKSGCRDIYRRKEYLNHQPGLNSHPWEFGRERAHSVL